MCFVRYNSNRILFIIAIVYVNKMGLLKNIESGSQRNILKTIITVESFCRRGRRTYYLL